MLYSNYNCDEIHNKLMNDLRRILPGKKLHVYSLFKLFKFTSKKEQLKLSLLMKICHNLKIV